MKRLLLIFFGLALGHLSMLAQELKPLAIPVTKVVLPQFSPEFHPVSQSGGPGKLIIIRCSPSFSKVPPLYIIIIDQAEYIVDSVFFLKTPVNWIAKINVVKEAGDPRGKVILEYKNRKEKAVLRLLKRRNGNHKFSTSYH
ncbi:MAG: hypothetical protein HEP71_04320 [Roseivirga sp.]|nr:hypothetical protein [Roseivirga sp.]